jgi:hypothetical protein
MSSLPPVPSFNMVLGNTGDLLLESLDLGAEAYRYSFSRLLLSHRLLHVQQRKNLLIIYLPQIGLQQKTLDSTLEKDRVFKVRE